MYILSTSMGGDDNDAVLYWFHFGLIKLNKINVCLARNTNWRIAVSKKPSYSDLEERLQSSEMLLAEHNISGASHKKNASQLNSLLKNIPGMVYSAYSDWSLEIISGSKNICGYSSSDFLQGKVSWLDIIHPQDRGRIQEEGSIMVEKTMELVHSYRIKTKTGKVRWVEDHKVSILSPSGELLRVDGVVFDITDKMVADESL